MSLKLEHFFLSPVEVVKVTTQNLQEVAEWCGGKVAKTESRRVQGRMDSYVWVPTPKGTQISWAFPGMFITKRLVLTVKNEMRITYAVFRRDYFEKNYFESPTAAVDQTWGRKDANVKHPKMQGKPQGKAGKPKDLELNVSIPEGSTTEEVEGAITEAVKVLEEQGVLHSGSPEVIYKKDGVDPSEILPTEPTLSPREVHDLQIQSVSLDSQPNAFGGTIEVVEEAEREANVEAQLAQTPVE